jgi:hypothetical protein
MNRKSLILRIVSASFIIIMFTACNSSNSDTLREISKRRTCRANMNIICTDQANYCDANGEWAETIEQLDEYAGRPQPLTCPESGEDYLLELLDSGYVISCPDGHGSINTGRRSWTGGE